MDTIDVNITHRVNDILASWGSDANGLPTERAWQALAHCASDQPVTLVNFFKMREHAAYPKSYAGGDTEITGNEAFQRYANVSMPSLEKVGGRFLLVAPFGETFIGAEEDWDLVAIGSYPNPSTLLALFELEEYREAYLHRMAACADQKVSLCFG